jgi:hypothetical protein
MPVQWYGSGAKANGVCVPSAIPAVCAGCGRDREAGHPWLCPVLIRLSAQLLATCDPDRTGWRDRARTLAEATGKPFGREARHWRAVAEEPDMPSPADGYDEIDTPDLLPNGAGDGLREELSPTGCSRPGSSGILTTQLVEAMNRAFGSGGWTVCPDPLSPNRESPQ